MGTDRLAYMLAGCAVFLSPYNVLRPPSVYFTAADGMMLMAFLVLLGSGRLPFEPFGRLTPVWYVGFLAIVGGLVIGGIAHQRLVTGVDIIAQYAFAMVVLPWVLGGRDAEQAKRLLLVWVASIVVVMLHGIYLMDFASDPPDNMVSPSGRLRGVLERETELGAIAALAAVATMYLATERIISFAATLIFSAVLLYGIVLTASNTGLLALASGAVSFTILQRSRRHYVMVGLLIALSCTALVLGGDDLLPQSFRNRVAGALSSGDLMQAGTFDDRMELTREGWLVSADHILIGLGANGFRVTTHGQPVHNTYVLLLVEGGLLSLVGLSTIIGLMAFRGVTLLLKGETRNLGAMVAAVAVIFGLVLNTFPHIYARFFIVPLVLVTSLAVAGRSVRQGPIAGLR